MVTTVEFTSPTQFNKLRKFAVTVSENLIQIKFLQI